MIARLAELREFDELKQYADERRESEVQALARKTFSSPENHDTVEWERLKAFWAGVDMILGAPRKMTVSESKETSGRPRR